MWCLQLPENHMRHTESICSRNWSCKKSEVVSRSDNIFWHQYRGTYWRIFPLGYKKLRNFCVGKQRHSDFVLITLANPQIPLSFIILAFRKLHTHSDTSQQKTPSVSNPKKLIFRRVWKEKTYTTYATISSFFEASSSSSQPTVIHCSEFTAKILTYPTLSLATPTIVVLAQVPPANLNPSPLI